MSTPRNPAGKSLRRSASQPAGEVPRTSASQPASEPLHASASQSTGEPQRRSQSQPTGEALRRSASQPAGEPLHASQSQPAGEPRTRGRTPRADAPRPGPTRADDPLPHPLRIGDVARLVGTTPRTIRYYEEIGLLAQGAARPSGQHRTYTDAEVERLREVMRLKHLLGVTLEELKTLLSAEEARAAVRAQLRREDVNPERRRALLEEALGHIDRQLELVEHRAGELAKLKGELGETRRRVRRKLRELNEAPTAALSA